MGKQFDTTVPAVRLWSRSTTAVWCKTAEEHGSLSNMANGMPLSVERVRDGQVVETIVFPSGEHLFQWIGFLGLPEHQARILAAGHAMQSKFVAWERVKERRRDWREMNVRGMAFVQTVRLQSARYRAALAGTGDREIAELSMKDSFWGAKPQPSGDLLGQNVVGSLQKQLRDGARLWELDDLRVPMHLVGEIPAAPSPRPVAIVDPSASLKSRLLGTRAVG